MEGVAGVGAGAVWVGAAVVWKGGLGADRRRLTGLCLFRRAFGRIWSRIARIVLPSANHRP